jgi:hypothetical protein
MLSRNYRRFITNLQVCMTMTTMIIKNTTH